MARHRRVRTEPAPGTDPAPSTGPERASEDEPTSWGDTARSNDEQLHRDVPPHY